MLRACTLIVVLALSVPACAEDTGENEALIMRLIFEDCMGFVDRGHLPFQGLVQPHLTPEGEQAVADLDLGAPIFAGRAHLISERYVSAWGEAGDSRFCIIQASSSSPLPVAFAVRKEGFLDMITARAAIYGMTETEMPAKFGTRQVSIWSEPGDDTPERSIALVPSSSIAWKDTHAEVGMIIVTADLDQPSS